uniref:Uncharacterized protein n=1 Tax=Zea mays TaxID=4577 RepID=A0A804QX10_MAIZE
MSAIEILRSIIHGSASRMSSSNFGGLDGVLLEGVCVSDRNTSELLSDHSAAMYHWRVDLLESSVQNQKPQVLEKNAHWQEKNGFQQVLCDESGQFCCCFQLMRCWFLFPLEMAEGITNLGKAFFLLAR